MIRCKDLRVHLGTTLALELPHFEVAERERVGVEGTNGSGKSTLLRVLAGLLAPTAGSLAGLPPPGRAVLVHQQPYLFRGTALDNVRYALRLARREPSEAADWLARLDAEPLAERRARDLSHGEQRRIALARAMAVRPSLLLLDEPVAGLDEAGAAALNEWLADYEGTLVVAAPDLEGMPVERVVRLTASA